MLALRNQGIKYCPKCQQYKPLTEFYKNKRRADGLHCYCRTCFLAVAEAWRRAHPEKHRQYARTSAKRNPEMKRACAQRYRERHRAELAAKARDYYRRNSDKVKAYVARWCEANPEKVKATQARQRERNRDRIRERNRLWAKAHPESVCETQRRRRARLRTTKIEGFTHTQLEARLSMYGGRCWICGRPADCVDHVKPIAKGGPHILANLRPICTTCNCRKRDLWPLGEADLRWIASGGQSQQVKT